MAPADFRRLIDFRTRCDDETPKAFADMIHRMTEPTRMATPFYSAASKRRIADDGSSLAVAAALPVARHAGARLIDRRIADDYKMSKAFANVLFQLRSRSHTTCRTCSGLKTEKPAGRALRLRASVADSSAAVRVDRHSL
jgi:hypothetical protein